MTAEKSGRQIKKSVLALAAVGVIGGATFAGFLASQNNNAEAAVQTVAQSVEIETEKIANPQQESPKTTTISTDPEATTSTDSDVIEWVDGMDPLDLLTEEELNRLMGKDTQSVDNNSSQVTAKPAPRNNTPSSGGSNNNNQDLADGIPTMEDLMGGGSNSGGSAPSTNSTCSEENIDACRSGFSAPSFEFAGYHSCYKDGDGTVVLKGLVRMVGGNYKDFSWSVPTEGGMGIVTSRVSKATYSLSWYATVAFYSMDSRYQGMIAEEGAHGNETISESQLDSSCRF